MRENWPWQQLLDEAEGKVAAYQAEAEVQRLLEHKSLRRRVAQALIWLAERVDQSALTDQASKYTPA